MNAIPEPFFAISDLSFDKHILPKTNASLGEEQQHHSKSRSRQSTPEPIVERQQARPVLRLTTLQQANFWKE